MKKSEVKLTAKQRICRSKGSVIMELEYVQDGEYLLPAIKLSDPPDAPPLGLYGELHKTHFPQQEIEKPQAQQGVIGKK